MARQPEAGSRPVPFAILPLPSELSLHQLRAHVLPARPWAKGNSTHDQNETCQHVRKVGAQRRMSEHFATNPSGQKDPARVPGRAQVLTPSSWERGQGGRGFRRRVQVQRSVWRL